MDKFTQNVVVDGMDYLVDIECSPEFMISLIDEKIARIDELLAEMDRLKGGFDG